MHHTKSSFRILGNMEGLFDEERQKENFFLNTPKWVLEEEKYMSLLRTKNIKKGLPTLGHSVTICGKNFSYDHRKNFSLIPSKKVKSFRLKRYESPKKVKNNDISLQRRDKREIEFLEPFTNSYCNSDDWSEDADWSYRTSDFDNFSEEEYDDYGCSIC